MVRKKKKRVNKRLGEPFGARARRALARASKVVAIVALVSGLSAFGWWSYRWVTTTPYLEVETIRVAGAERVSEEDVLRLASRLRGRNIVTLKAADVVGTLKNEPWIEDVVVKRRPPATVIVEITERRPMALVRMDDLYVMDNHGVVFKKFSYDDLLDLPVVTGLSKDGDVSKGAAKSVEDALFSLMGLLRDRKGFALKDVSEIHLDDVYGLSIYTLDGGVRLDVGFNNFEQKLVSFERILRARQNTLRGIEAMDLNNEREVIVKFSSNVVKEGGVI